MEIASIVHEPQSYLGRPYITHCVAVMNQVADMTPVYEARIVGILHDVLEDGTRLRWMTYGYLYKEFGFAVAEWVAVLTHYQGIPYFDYIREIKAYGGIPALVKQADLLCNLRAAFVYQNPKRSLAFRYIRALEILETK